MLRPAIAHLMSPSRAISAQQILGHEPAGKAGRAIDDQVVGARERCSALAMTASFIVAGAAIGLGDRRNVKRPSVEEWSTGSGGSTGCALGHSSGACLLLAPLQMSAPSVVRRDGAMSHRDPLRTWLAPARLSEKVQRLWPLWPRAGEGECDSQSRDAVLDVGARRDLVISGRPFWDTCRLAPGQEPFRA